MRPHAALGHRRLAVIDLPGGRAADDAARRRQGPLVIIYCGETYNFAELREELRRRGHRFPTDSDTEVVLHGYLEWGEARRRAAQRHVRLRRLGRREDREQLVMIRDRMGIKPLYYYPTPDGVLLRLRAQGDPGQPAGAERVVDLDGLRELFAFVKTPGQALWHGMREVRARHRRHRRP